MVASYLIFALQCLLPIFDMGVGEYLGLSIVNPEAQAREYTITATPPTGTNAQIGRLILNPGAQRAFLLSEILGGAPPSSGWIRIDSAASGCMSYLASGNDEFLAGTDAAASSSTALVLPHISVNTGFVELDHTDTVISIVNAVIEPASVTAQLVGLDTGIIGTVSMTDTGDSGSTGRVSELFREVLPNNSLGGKKFDGYCGFRRMCPSARGNVSIRRYHEACSVVDRYHPSFRMPSSRTSSLEVGTSMNL